MSQQQLLLVSLEDLVSPDHLYRKFNALWDFRSVERSLKEIEKENNYKGYCTEPAKRHALKKGCHLAAVKKNNMKGKNRNLDRWYSHLRAPYERAFSQ